MICKAFFWTISIISDRYFGRFLCQITQQYSRTERNRAQYMWSRSCGGTHLRRSTRMMWRRFDAWLVGILMCLFHFMLSWIIRPRTLWELTVSSTLLLSQEADQHFFTLTCVTFHPIIIGPYRSTFRGRLNYWDRFSG